MNIYINTPRRNSTFLNIPYMLESMSIPPYSENQPCPRSAKIVTSSTHAHFLPLPLSKFTSKDHNESHAFDFCFVGDPLLGDGARARGDFDGDVAALRVCLSSASVAVPLRHHHKAGAQVVLT